jgi:hypothetical protein
MPQKFKSELQLEILNNANADTDEFLVADTNGVIKFRTGAELLSDIGGASASGYVPYTGATANLDLGINNILAAKGTFSSSGSGDTVGITHSSGSGIALNITKGGNGEGLYINKTSGSGNAATIIGTLNATTLVKSGGTSSQFLKADGSVDSTSYGTGSVTSVGLSSATSGVTIGSTPITTSGTITLAIATASGSQQGLLSSTDWTTFNNKQNALTNPVTGTGTTNYLPKFTGTSTIGNSVIQESSNKIGIGITPVYTLDVLQSGATTAVNSFSMARITGGNATANDLTLIGPNTSQVRIKFGDTDDSSVGEVGYNHSTNTMRFNTNGSQKMTLDASGNLGLGVTPSAWDSAYRVLQNTGGSLIGASGELQLWQNAFFNGTSSIYIASSTATRYNMTSGQHIWYNAPSGTAGNAITFTQAMTLNASGNLSIGNTNNTFKLDVSGTGRFVNASTFQGIFSGWSTSGANSASGAISLGNTAAYRGVISYAADGDTTLSFDNSYDSTGAVMRFRMRTAGTAVNALTIAGTGAATFSGKTNIVKSHADYAFTVVNTDSNGYGMYLQAGSTNNAIDVFNAAGSTQLFKLTGTGAATFSSSIAATSATFSDLVTTTSVFRITQASVARGGLYTYNQVLGSGTDYSVGIFSEAEAFIATGGTSTKRLVITSGGNVGIGTGSPNSLLEVNRTITFSSIDTYAQLVVKTTSGANGKLLNIGVDETNSVSFIQSLNRGTDVMPLSLQRYGGNVGIGTASPTYLFDVLSSSVSTARFKDSARFCLVTIESSGTNQSSYLEFKPTGTGSAIFQVGGSDKMAITSGGNVEINTGSIKTGEPDTGWGRAAIKIGASVSGEAFNVTHYLPVSVDGTVYYINLNSSTP